MCIVPVPTYPIYICVCLQLCETYYNNRHSLGQILVVRCGFFFTRKIYRATPVSNVAAWKEVIMLFAVTTFPLTPVNLKESGAVIADRGLAEYKFQYSLPWYDILVQVGFELESLTSTKEIEETEGFTREKPTHQALDPPFTCTCTVLVDGALVDAAGALVCAFEGAGGVLEGALVEGAEVAALVEVVALVAAGAVVGALVAAGAVVGALVIAGPLLTGAAVGALVTGAAVGAVVDGVDVEEAH